MCLSLRLCVELCVLCYVPKASDDRIRRLWCRALLFHRLLLFHCHCNAIECVSPCQKDLNLPGSFFCLIQHRFLDYDQRKIPKQPYLLYICWCPIFLSLHKFIPSFLLYLPNPKSTALSFLPNWIWKQLYNSLIAYSELSVITAM